MIVIFLTLFAVILSVVLIKTDIHFVFKLLLMLISFYIGSAIYFSFDSHKGWPVSIYVENRKNVRLEVLSVQVYEPNSARPGLIYVWTRTPVEDIKKKQEENSKITQKLSPWKVFGYWPTYVITPRVYELPYTQSTAERAMGADQELSLGNRVFMTFDGRAPRGNGDATEGNPGDLEGNKGKKKRGHGGSQQPDPNDTSKSEVDATGVEFTTQSTIPEKETLEEKMLRQAPAAGPPIVTSPGGQFGR